MRKLNDFTTVRRIPNIRRVLARLSPLLVLLGLVLFPFGWMGEWWPAFGRGLDRVFPTDIFHAIGHALLFLALGLMTLALIPRLRAQPGRYIGCLLLVSVAQECFQLVYKGRWLWFDTSRDLLTDLIGIVVAFVLVWWCCSPRRL